MKRMAKKNKIVKNIKHLPCIMLFLAILLGNVGNAYSIDDDKSHSHYAEVISNDSLYIFWSGLGDSVKYIRLYHKQYPNTDYEYTDYAITESTFHCYITGLNLSNEKHVFYSKILDKDYNNIAEFPRFSPVFLMLSITPSPDPNFSNDPELRIPKYWFQEINNKNIVIYRKIEDESVFKQIAIKNIASEEDLFFIDTTINSECSKIVSYYITSGNSQSKSQTRAEQYTENHRPLSPKMKKIGVVDGNLQIDWIKSESPDVEFYYIRKLNEYNNWVSIPGVSCDNISPYDTSFVIYTDYCDAMGGLDYSVYRVFSIDSCGNTSLETNDDYLSPMAFYKADYDSCNSFMLRWSDDRCLRETEYYKLIIVNFTGDTIFNERILDYSPELNTYEYEFNQIDETYYGSITLNIVACNKYGEEAYSCPRVENVLNISSPPEKIDILSVEWIDEKTNKIVYDVDDQFEGSYQLFKRYNDYSSGTAVEYSVLIEDNLNPTQKEYTDDFTADGGSLKNDKPYMYVIKAKNKCDVNFQDSAFIRSIYLEGEKSKIDAFVQLCFSKVMKIIPDNSSGEYVIVINGNETIPFISNDCDLDIINKCNPDLDKYHCDSYTEADYSKSYQVIFNFRQNDTVYESRSNVLFINLLEVDSIVMANAIIINADNPVNSKFGPMNISQFRALGIVNYDFRIFNSWGEMVWHSTDVSTKQYWEGKSDKDNYLPQGTYLYSIDIEVADQKHYNRKGTVTLFNKNF